MCYRPIHIGNKSSYPVPGISYDGYDVPCGKCLECRQQKQSEWQTRIAFELSSLYSRHGRAVFLTFTYSPTCLPVYEDASYIVDETTKEHFNVPCFNHGDVLAFLNRIKVYMNKKYGKGTYKYFVCSEYGKETKRPHYHAIFFLEPCVDWFDFVEKCRSKWTYGFMFPKYDRYRQCYIDKKGNAIKDGKPCISSLGGCSKYVSKYITKDMSYYGTPVISQYLQVPANRDRMRLYLPKHWQSNGLGISALGSLNVDDDASVKDALQNGILNPLTFEYVPLPSYIINKLMYYNVDNGRVSEKNGNKLYDRYLTDFGRQYMFHVFCTRVARYAQKMSETFQMSASPFTTFPDKFFTSWFSVGITDIKDPTQFVPAAFYKVVYKYAPSNIIHLILKGSYGDIDGLFNSEYAFLLWYANKDTERLRELHLSQKYKFSLHDTDTHSACFNHLQYIVHCYEKFAFERARLRCEEFKRRADEAQRLRSLYTHRYDNSLC